VFEANVDIFVFSSLCLGESSKVMGDRTDLQQEHSRIERTRPWRALMSAPKVNQPNECMTLSARQGVQAPCVFDPFVFIAVPARHSQIRKATRLGQTWSAICSWS